MRQSTHAAASVPAFKDSLPVTTSTYLLLNFENLQPPPEHIAQVRGDDCHLWIFHGPHQNRFSAELVKAWQPLGRRVEFIQCSKPGRNALDFHIAFHLGQLHQRTHSAGEASRFVVVTGDGGFDAIFIHMRELGCVVDKAASIPAALVIAAQEGYEAGVQPPVTRPTKGLIRPTPVAPKKAGAAKSATSPRKTPAAGDVDAVVERLRQHVKSRPSNRAALQRYVIAQLGNGVTEGVGKVIVNSLAQRGFVSFDGKKIIYQIPAAQDRPPGRAETRFS